MEENSSARCVSVDTAANTVTYNICLNYEYGSTVPLYLNQWKIVDFNNPSTDLSALVPPISTTPPLFSFNPLPITGSTNPPYSPIAFCFNITVPNTINKLEVILGFGRVNNGDATCISPLAIDLPPCYSGGGGSCGNCNIRTGTPNIYRPSSYDDLIIIDQPIFSTSNILELKAEVLYYGHRTSDTLCQVCEKRSSHLGAFYSYNGINTVFENMMTYPVGFASADWISVFGKHLPIPTRPYSRILEWYSNYSGGQGTRLPSSGARLNLAIGVPKENTLACCSDFFQICIRYTMIDDECTICSVVRCYDVLRGNTMPISGPGSPSRDLDVLNAYELQDHPLIPTIELKSSAPSSLNQNQ
ncbi:MAG: hypothetical protein AAFV80_10990 [Bacteroidota bacterium]